MKIREQIDAVLRGERPQDVIETIGDWHTRYPDGRRVPMTPAEVKDHFTPIGQRNAAAWTAATSGPYGVSTPKTAEPEKIGDVSGQPETPEEHVQHVQKHLEAFNAVQRLHGKYGASDTEPDWHFHDVLRNAVHGKPHRAPNSSGGWEIFSEKSQGGDPRFRGSGKAVRDLRKAAIAAYHAVRKGMRHKNPEVRKAVKKHVRDFAWRVDI